MSCKLNKKYNFYFLRILTEENVSDCEWLMSAISSANLTYSAVISLGIFRGLACSMHWKAVQSV